VNVGSVNSATASGDTSNRSALTRQAMGAFILRGTGCSLAAPAQRSI
jgi:hypothetical protein